MCRSGKESARKAWLRGAQVSPEPGFPSAFPSLPTHISTAWSCPCWDLFLWPRAFFLAHAHRPHPSPHGHSSALRTLCVCRAERTGHTNPGENGKVMLVLSGGWWG